MECCRGCIFVKTVIMLSRLLRLAWRNIWRNPTYSVVTIAGLSLGICASICIYVIVRFEFSYDTFHPEGKRIYRVMAQLTLPTGEKERYMVIPPAALRYGRSSLTGAEAVAGIIAYPAGTVVTGQGQVGGRGRVAATGGKRMPAENVAIAEGSYFDIFSYEWLAGDR